MKSNSVRVQNAVNLSVEAMSFYSSKNYLEAIKTWNSVLEIITENQKDFNLVERVMITFNKARAYQNVSNYVLAKHYYELVLGLQPGHAKASDYLKNLHKLGQHTLDELQIILEMVHNSYENQIDKIKILRSIESKKYEPSLKRLIKNDLKDDLIDWLSDVGSLNEAIAKISGQPGHYTDTAKLYVYAINLINKQLRENPNLDVYAKKMKILYVALNNVEVDLFAVVANEQKHKSTNVLLEISPYKQHLVDLRGYTENKLLEVDGHSEEDVEAYIKSARSLFLDIASKQRGLLATLYEEWEKKLGEPPCKYSVIGLGSMALNQTTPYSDLEFAILTENDEYKKSSEIKVKNYFTNLTHLVHLKVIEFGETPMPSSRYGIKLDDLIDVGVNFDLGGKTPLGRIEQDKPYSLIQTVNGMLRYVYNEGNKASHIDKNLPYILEKPCYVFGDEILFSDYKKSIKEFLLQKPEGKTMLNCQIRALEVLRDGSVEFDYLKLDGCSRHVSGDIDRLKPNLFAVSGKLFKVKQEIYRLVDRLIYGLGMSYGLDGDSMWEVLDLLIDSEIINKEAATNLQYAVTFANMLRLKTYTHNHAQKENMSIFSVEKISSQAQNIFRLSEDELKEGGSLFKYFYIVLPFYNKLKDFCTGYESFTTEIRQCFFKSEVFFDNDHLSKGSVYARLLRYDEAIREYKCAKDVIIQTQQIDGMIALYLGNSLGKLYFESGDINEAVKEYNFCMQIYSKMHNMPKELLATVLNNAGTAFEHNWDYLKALRCHEESVKIYRELYRGRSHEKLANALNNLGNVYNRGIDLKLAEKYYTESLDIYKIICGNQPSAEAASVLNNLGNLYYYNKLDYNIALKYFAEGLEIFKKLYLEEPHPHIATSLQNVGNIYYTTGDNQHAMQYYENSLEMFATLYTGDYVPPIVADGWNNLGLLYRSLNKYEDSISYLHEALKIYVKTGSKVSGADTAVCLSNLADSYRQYQKYDLAIKYYNSAIEYYTKFYKTENCPDVSHVFNALANVYYDLENYSEALNCCFRSIEICKKIYKMELHSDMRPALYNIGAILCDDGREIEAQDYFQKYYKACNIHGESHKFSSAHFAYNGNVEDWICQSGFMGDNMSHDSIFN